MLFTALLIAIATALVTPRFEVFTSGIVVVTGASSGIGENAAGMIAARTHFTVFAGVRKQTDAHRLAHTYPGVCPVFLDVTSSESIAAAVAFVRNASAARLAGRTARLHC